MGVALVFELELFFFLDFVAICQYYVVKQLYAARAKRGKGELFDKKVVEVLVSRINANKVIHAYTLYEKLGQALSLYRKCRRSENVRMDFFEYIDKDVSESDYEEEMDKYIFLNTGDLIILNAIANLEGKCNFDEDEEYIIEAIEVVKNAVTESGLISSQATKNNSVFSAVQEDIAVR